MDATLANYIKMRAAIADMKFKAWSDVCASWLSELRTVS